MIPFVGMLLTRWSRRTGGSAAALFCLLVPFAIILVMRAQVVDLGPITVESLMRMAGALAMLVGGPVTGVLLASAVHEERRTGARLLRVGRIDGSRAVLGYAVFGAVVALGSSSLCQMPAALLYGGSPVAWTGNVLRSWGVIVAIIPAATLLALVAPPPGVLVGEAVLMLLGASGVAQLLDAGADFESLELGHAVAFALATNLVGLPAVGWVWRRTSSRLWT